MTCPNGTIPDPETNICPLVNQPTTTITRTINSAGTSPCPTNQVLNPLTNGCISTRSPEGQVVLVNRSIQPLPIKTKPLQVVRTCGPGGAPTVYVFNQLTGRYVKATGEVGKSIIGKWNCLRYPPRPADFKFEPLAHQAQVADYFVKMPYRGILMYWSLGAGKTCGAIMMLDQYITTYGVKKIYVLSTGSLRENFLSEYCIKCGYERERVRQYFEFISYNYSLLGERLPNKRDMDNSIVVIDEVHNLINGYINKSENYMALYDLLRSLTNTKFILLSGTPILRSIDELYYILLLIKPEAFNSIEEFQSHFNYVYEIFIPDQYLISRISDVISQYRITSDYPAEIKECLAIPMTEDQYQLYNQAIMEELSTFAPTESLRLRNPARYKAQRTRWYLATSRLRSRQLGNMIYPPNIQILLKNNRAPPDKLVAEGGWIDQNFIDNLSQYSPKFHVLINLITGIPGKHVVYSQFKNRYGVFLIQSLLNYYGVSNLLFTGDLNDEQRCNTVNLYNNLNNINGEHYKVLLVTEAGSEGQSFLQTRAIHILEQSIDESAIRQVIGRVIRYRSHVALPEDLRYVLTYRYFALTPGEPVECNEAQPIRQTSDFYVYNRGLLRLRKISGLYNVLNNLSVVPIPS